MKEITYIFNGLSMDDREVGMRLTSRFTTLQRYGSENGLVVEAGYAFSFTAKGDEGKHSPLRLHVIANDHNLVEKEIQKITAEKFIKRDGYDVNPV